jgi:hypothetical protein
MLNEDHKLNLSEQSVSGASVSSNNLDKTASQNFNTKVPSKSKPKIKLSHQLNGSVPLTFYHKYKRIERKSKCIVKSVISNFLTYTVPHRASYEPLRITAYIF